MGVVRSWLKMSGSGLKRVEIDSSGLKMSKSGWKGVVVDGSGWEWIGVGGTMI